MLPRTPLSRGEGQVRIAVNYSIEGDEKNRVKFTTTPRLKAQKADYRFPSRVDNSCDELNFSTSKAKWRAEA